jgi:hypothetical protein
MLLLVAVLLCAWQCSAEDNDVQLKVDWPVFLGRHDLLWEFEWANGGLYTLQPSFSALSYCGAGGSPGQCCMEAGAALEKAPQTTEEGPLFIQLALHQNETWGCSKSASPPGECCLPVPLPASNSGKMSGCHAESDARWDYNQFFAVQVVNSSDSTFKLVSRGGGQQCASVKGSDMVSVGCSSAASDEGQLWKVLKPNTNTFLLQHMGRKTCIIAKDAEEAGTVTMGECSANADRSWLPMCPVAAEGQAVLPGWSCISHSASSPTPAPAPTPVPAPPRRVTLQPCVHTAHGATSNRRARKQAQQAQQWRVQLDGSIVSAASGDCLSVGEGGTAVVEACAPGSSKQAWAQYGSFFQNIAKKTKTVTLDPLDLDAAAPHHIGNCLQVATPGPFCDATVCPTSFAQHFSANMSLEVSGCHNGDRSQMFAAFSVSKTANGAKETSEIVEAEKENLIPLTWATCAYIGNGEVGLRVESEEGGTGVLHLLMDNVRYGGLCAACFVGRTLCNLLCWSLSLLCCCLLCQARCWWPPPTERLFPSTH